MSFVHTVKKGDTLNSIANQYGFRNYKEAGINSVQSGNFDRIGIGEQITLNNYDPNKVQTSSTPTPPVISSTDNAQTFNDNKAKLDKILAGQNPNTETDTTTDTNKSALSKEEQAIKDAKDLGTATEVNTQIINDPLYTKSRADDQAKINEATLKMEADKEDYISSINTRLANIDAVTASTIERITLTADKRIKEQQRINQINTDRVRAYGVGGSGVYQPIQFSDAITERERKGAEEVNNLERLRDQAIADAETAGRLGKSDLLDEKLKGLAEIEDKLRTKLSEIETESDQQYQLLRTLRKEKEAERLAKVKEVQDRLRAYVALNRDEFQNLTPDEIEGKIAEVMKSSNLSYSEAYNAIMDGIQVNLDDEKAKAEIERIKADTAYKQQQANTEKSQQYKNYKSANNETKNPTVAEMSADIPDSFANEADAEAKRQEFIKKYGKTGATHWNSVFEITDPELGTKKYNYPIGSKSSSGVLVSPDGTQQVSIADLTPEQIKEAKDAGWK